MIALGMLRVQVITPTPAPLGGTAARAAVYGQEWSLGIVLFIFFIGALCGAGAYGLLTEPQKASSFRLASWFGFIVGIAGALGHSVFVDLRSDEKFIPVFDQTTLLWAGVAVISLLIPFVSEFSFGGASFKLTETKETATSVLEDATDLT